MNSGKKIKSKPSGAQYKKLRLEKKIREAKDEDTEDTLMKF